jgi:hypothetical protein
MGLAVGAWRDGDAAAARDAIARLLAEEPEFRLSATHPLPYRDETAWPDYLATLRAAGAPA